MSATSWVRVPIGPEAAQWTTLPIERTVLVVVHTITSVNRLADILSVFDSDSRVQIVFTAIGASAVSAGVVNALTALGATVIPWDQAVQTEFGLALSVNHSGELWRIAAPLAVLSHGIGYTKYAARNRNPAVPALVEPGAGSREPGAGSREPGAGSREPGAGSREPGAGSREPGAGSREPGAGSREPGAGYGISPDWLLHDGRPFVDALVFSHDEQLARLAAVVPEALSAAVVAGDPCFDRLRASLPLRDRYRRRLHPGRPTTVVTVSSTWGRHSLLGAWPSLIREVLSELPIDSYRVLLVAHPNVWYAHGPWQLRNWLADAVRAGLTVVDPLAGWQQAVLASDVLIGDHGAVTGYAAALGIPTLLGTHRAADIVDGTAIDALTRVAPRLDPGRPVGEQLLAAMDHGDPARSRPVADLISTVPDQSAQRLRALFYRLLSLPEPAADPPVHAYPVADLPAGPPPVTATLVQGRAEHTGRRADIRLHRFPAEVLRHRSPRLPPVDGHLVVHVDHPMRTLRAQAGIIYRDRDRDRDGAGTDERTWLAETLDRWPACVLTAVVDPTSCTVYGGPNRTVRISCSDATLATPLLCASAVYLWLAEGNSWDDLPPRLWIHTDPRIPPMPATVSR